MKKRRTRLAWVLVVAAAVAIGYLVGRTGESAVNAQDVSPTAAMDRDYYVPNSEDLAQVPVRRRLRFGRTHLVAANPL
jgi:hypothetical protein